MPFQFTTNACVAHLHQVFQQLAVSGGNKLHSPFSYGAACQSFGSGACDASQII
jgi:hypothetical protein